jgi:hypothetical protein
MSTENTSSWNTANQHFLVAAVNVIKKQLELYSYSNGNGAETAAMAELTNAQNELAAAATAMPAPSALDTLISVFGLSSFEQAVLLLCAGIELSSDFSSLVGRLQGDPQLSLPTFNLALAALPDAHWSALSPAAPLRYWRLIELNNGQTISKSTIKIDEQILHYLTGVHYLDERLSAIMEPLTKKEPLVSSHNELVDNILQTYTHESNNDSLPVIQLTGDNTMDKDAIASFVCEQAGLYPYTIFANNLPTVPKDIIEMSRLWGREAALKSYALYIDCNGLDMADKYRLQSIVSFIEKTQGLIIISIQEELPKLNRPKNLFEVKKPTADEQLLLWKQVLGNSTDQIETQLRRLVAQFNLSTAVIHKASAEVKKDLPADDAWPDDKKEQFLNKLWKTCCVHTRPQVADLAKRIDPIADWDELILPALQKEILKEIVMQVKQRNKVYDDWGFAARSSRGLGITALFAGESGTGKTMASEVLAKALQLDLYRIDLSQVINKYIGETEKNLKQVFDAAEDGGAILLFDEADALFGKRSEVKDSHDRYANIEVSYLLQRMEAYRGLAILTTNMKTALDKAWMRRIRFVVQFPFPDTVQRTEIWRRAFPLSTPTGDLEMAKLAKLNIPGGNIKNIALNAAFIAADEGIPVSMSHISRAARSEYNKMEKPLTTMEMDTW